MFYDYQGYCFLYMNRVIIFQQRKKKFIFVIFSTKLLNSIFSGNGLVIDIISVSQKKNWNSFQMIRYWNVKQPCQSVENSIFPSNEKQLQSNQRLHVNGVSHQIFVFSRFRQPNLNSLFKQSCSCSISQAMKCVAHAALCRFAF